MDLILSHVGTDFDALASMALAAKLYPKAHMVFPGRLGAGAAEFYHLHRRHFPTLPTKQALSLSVSRIILVDTSLASRVGPFRLYLHRHDIELHIYDHHPPTAESVQGDQEWVEAVGAAATLLLERCQTKGIHLEPFEATLALIALHEETGSFRYSSTTSKDLEAASFVMKEGANLDVLDHFLRDALNPDQRSLFEEFLTSGHVYEYAAGTIFLASAQRTKSVFGLGLLASRLLELQGVDACCLALKVGPDTMLAARSASDAFDVNTWMQRFGGGGHRRAAAASKVKEPPFKVFDEIQDLASVGQAPSLVASDLMTTEVFSLPALSSIDSAAKALKQTGFPSACIIDDTGGLVGLVARQDLDKACDHGLGHAPATSVMTHKVISIAADTPLTDIRKIVVERGVGTIPVLENDKVIGLISRSDLLRDMYQASVSHTRSSTLLTHDMDLGLVPEPFRTWLVVAQELATEHHLHLYVVGGFVRDTLTGRATEDLDFVVEGDALKLAQALGDRLGAKVAPHPKYLTATLMFSDGLKLDLATARRETYVRPAALPEISQSHLKADLYRRDFTINALALRLTSDLQGTIIDFFGGLQDLEAKVIRVLHNHSFFDDPSRILRAIRFEIRLGLSIEPHTRQLIRAALEAGALTMTRPERLKREWRLALTESDPIRILERFETFKVLEHLHSDLKFQGRVKERTSYAFALITRHPELLAREEFWQVPLYLFAIEIGVQATSELQERYDWQVLDWPWPLVPTIGRLCRSSLRPSELGMILDALPPLALVIFASLSHHVRFQKRVEHYLSRLRGQKPPLSGAEIIACGVRAGPEVKTWKAVLLNALRDEEIGSSQDAMIWLTQQLASTDNSSSLTPSSLL